MKTIISIILLSIGLCVGCTEQKTTPKSSTEEVPKVSTEKAPEKITESNHTKDSDNHVTVWVDNLNLREQPNTKSKVVTQIKDNTRLTLTGEKTDYKDSIVLRGILFHEPWVKVQTPDGKSGWVFQGAVNEPGLERGRIYTQEEKKIHKIIRNFKAQKNDPIEISNRIKQKLGMISLGRNHRYQLNQDMFFPVYKFSEEVIGIMYEYVDEAEYSEKRDSIYKEYIPDGSDFIYMNRPRKGFEAITCSSKRLSTLIKHDKISSARTQKNIDLTFYVYGTLGHTTSRIRDFLFYMNECDVYEVYRFMELDEAIGQPLFASFEEINLVSPSNAKMINHLSDKTLDRTQEYGPDKPDKVFKQIQGTELYFLYDDPFLYNNNDLLSKPSRSLVLNAGDSLLVTLWVSWPLFFSCW